LIRSAPARWFTALEPLLARLDTPDKVIALLDTSRVSAISFKTLDTFSAVQGSSDAVQFTVLGAHQVISTLRQRTTLIDIGDKRGKSWKDFQRDAHEHAAVGDLIDGRHGSRDVSVAAAAELEQMGQVATWPHAEFAAVAPVVRLAWIERFSQFDRPALLRDLTVLPQYARLDRETRRRLQEFVDWLFGRVSSPDRDAVNLMNDLVRLCLLLASHAPVNRIIAGHVPRPTPVRPGIQIPIKPLNPELVRVGMDFQVWHASSLVASGKVEDLVQGEITARVTKVLSTTTTLDSTMKVQFVPGRNPEINRHPKMSLRTPLPAACGGCVRAHADDDARHAATLLADALRTASLPASTEGRTRRHPASRARANFRAPQPVIPRCISSASRDVMSQAVVRCPRPAQPMLSSFPRASDAIVALAGYAGGAPADEWFWPKWCGWRADASRRTLVAVAQAAHGVPGRYRRRRSCRSSDQAGVDALLSSVPTGQGARWLRLVADQSVAGRCAADGGHRLLVFARSSAGGEGHGDRMTIA
jgi:hypothetical protein